ncbi:MAG: N-acetyl sugar amidotransferase [Flavobacteriaceae bacterium TMED238]|nr:MAG: N-acetyl sugar amidotransferase [Flavobacteriaceae bacterium TMED238]
MKDYQRCSLTVMDNIEDPHIKFDGNGICNYYHEYNNAIKLFNKQYHNKNEILKNTFLKILKDTSKQKYNCIIGMSGGVDSSYLCYLAKKYGLNPLVVHVDNGWNADIAQKNIEKVVNKLDLDLYTHVIDWEEFREMQVAYIKSSVVDIEVLSDHAINAILYKQARKWGIKHCLSGNNMQTEFILPRYWTFNKMDIDNIKDILKIFGKVHFNQLKTYPYISPEMLFIYDKLNSVTKFDPLNFIDYQYDEAKKTLINKLGWENYGGKHCESIWTRFYQGYILPKKFNIDKRKAHLSNQIMAGDLTKEEALNTLEKPPYDIDLINQDYEYILKKLQISKEQFEKYLATPRIEHTQYKYDKGLRHKYRYINFFLRFFNRKSSELTTPTSNI